jgi:hyperpolarization activated cyclic nucleotide-gated potassium channel 1
LFLVHKFTIDKIVSVYETAINLSKRFSSYLTLVKLLMFFFYVVHLFACIWYWVGKYYESEPDNWLIRANVVDVTWDH